MNPDLYAYVGEDEFGSGEVGLKQGDVPSGRIPLVSTSRDKLEQGYMVAGISAQAEHFGVEIRLVRYVAVEVVRTFPPA